MPDGEDRADQQRDKHGNISPHVFRDIMRVVGIMRVRVAPGLWEWDCPGPCEWDVCEWVSLIITADKEREQEDPDEIDEVPEQAGDFHAVGVTFRVGPPHLCAGPQM